VKGREFKAHARACGMGHMNFHQLRHGAASLLIAQGVFLKIVQETLGHSTYQITADIYAHVASELKQVAADDIDQALGSGA
jgi:integrase